MLISTDELKIALLLLVVYTNTAIQSAKMQSLPLHENCPYFYANYMRITDTIL